MLKNRGKKNLDHRSLERMNLPKLVVSLLISRHKQIILLIPCLMMCAPLQIASTAHGDTLFQRIKLGFLHEIFSEFLTNSFQEFGIRKAILFHFLRQIKIHKASNLFEVPGLVFLSFVMMHTVGIKHITRWHESFIPLIFTGVKQER